GDTEIKEKEKEAKPIRFQMDGVAEEEKLPMELFESVSKAIRQNMKFGTDLHAKEQNQGEEIEEGELGEADGGGEGTREDYQKRIRLDGDDEEGGILTVDRDRREAHYDISDWLADPIDSRSSTRRADALLGRPRQQLVVAASLLQNLPNIAGLTR